MVDLEGILTSNISIIAQWQDHCNLELKSGGYELKRSMESANEWLLTLSSSTPMNVTPLELIIQVPEYINLKVYSDGKLNLGLKNKVMHHAIECTRIGDT